jgi:hypothetical protein
MRFFDLDIELSDEEILADLCYPAPAPTPYRRNEPAEDEWARRGVSRKTLRCGLAGGSVAGQAEETCNQSQWR